jgi:hypothetical protein
LTAGLAFASYLWFSQNEVAGFLFAPTQFVSFMFFVPHLVIGGLLLSTGVVRPYYVGPLGVSSRSIWRSLTFLAIAWTLFCTGVWVARKIRFLAKRARVSDYSGTERGIFEQTRTGILCSGLGFIVLGMAGMARAVAAGSTAGQQSGEGTVEVFVSALFPLGLFLVLWCREAITNRVMKSMLAFVVVVAVVLLMFFEGSRATLMKGVLVFAAVVVFRTRIVSKARILRIAALGAAALFFGLTVGTSVRVEQRLLRLPPQARSSVPNSIPVEPLAPTVATTIAPPTSEVEERRGAQPPFQRSSAPSTIAEGLPRSAAQDVPVQEPNISTSLPEAESTEPLIWPYDPGPGSVNLSALGWIVPKVLLSPESLAARREASTRALAGLTKRSPVKVFQEATRLVGDRLDAVASLAVVIQHAEHKLQEEPPSVRANLGRSVLVGLVPRWFWTDKPTVNDPRALATVYFGVSNNSYAVTSVNDLWRQFGLLGVVAGFLVLGLLLGALHTLCTTSLKPARSSGLREAFYFVLLLRGINLEADFVSNVPNLTRVGVVAGCGILIASCSDHVWRKRTRSVHAPV